MKAEQLETLRQKFDQVDEDASQIVALAATMKYLLDDEYFTSDLCFGVLCLYSTGTKREALVRQLEVGRLLYYQTKGHFDRRKKRRQSYITIREDLQKKLPLE